jgi:hypothetical protein
MFPAGAELQRHAEGPPAQASGDGEVGAPEKAASMERPRRRRQRAIDKAVRLEWELRVAGIVPRY